jgi:hypothetical protein
MAKSASKWRSLLANGEVCGASALQYLRYITDAQSMHTGVIGDSMSEKEGTCKIGRPAWIDRWKQRRAGFRAIIVVKNRGNSRGVKGGRKAKADERERCHTVGTRLPDRARAPEAKSPHPNWKLLSKTSVLPPVRRCGESAGSRQRLGFSPVGKGRSWC